jgi:hypothetical protein
MRVDAWTQTSSACSGTAIYLSVDSSSLLVCSLTAYCYSLHAGDDASDDDEGSDVGSDLSDLSADGDSDNDESSSFYSGTTPFSLLLRFTLFLMSGVLADEDGGEYQPPPSYAGRRKDQ